MEKNDKIPSKNAITLLIVFFMYGLGSSCDEYRVLFMKAHGMSPSNCGYVLAFASLLTVVSRPLAGALADKLRTRKWVYITCVSMWCFTVTALVVFRHAMIAGFLVCAGIIPIISLFEQGVYGMIEADGVQACLINKKLDYSLIRMCLSIGYCGINFLYTPITEHFGPTAPFICTTVFALAMLILTPGLKFFRADAADEMLKVMGDDTEPDSHITQQEQGTLDIKLIFRNYFLMTFVLLAFFQNLGGNISSYLVYLIKELNINESVLGTATGIRVAGEIMIMPFIPLIKKKVSLPMLQIVAVGFQIIMLCLFIFAKSPAIILGAMVFNGFAWGITLGTTALYLRKLAPKGLSTTTMSLTAITQGIAAVAANIGGGILVEIYGIFTLCKFSLLSLCIWVVLYIAAWNFGRRVLKKEPPVPMFIKKQSA